MTAREWPGGAIKHGQGSHRHGLGRDPASAPPTTARGEAIGSRSSSGVPRERDRLLVRQRGNGRRPSHFGAPRPRRASAMTLGPQVGAPGPPSCPLSRQAASPRRSPRPGAFASGARPLASMSSAAGPCCVTWVSRSRVGHEELAALPGKRLRPREEGAPPPLQDRARSRRGVPHRRTGPRPRHSLRGTRRDGDGPARAGGGARTSPG